MVKGCNKTDLYKFEYVTALRKQALSEKAAIKCWQQSTGIR